MLTLVRYSEIGLKGDYARKRMESLLRRNIMEAIESKGETAEIRNERGRIYVSFAGSAMNIDSALSHTFGVKSFSHVVPIEFSDLHGLVKEVLAIHRESVSGKKFAIRSRCVGTHSFDSRDLSREAGAALFPYSVGVDLEHPDVEIYIECRERVAYTFTDIFSGPGGLPLGSEGRMVALVSGGIDSPVASWFIMKRGCPVDFVFVSLAHPIDTVDFLRAVRPLAMQWSHGVTPNLHIIDGSEIVSSLAVSGRFKIPGITFKRVIYRLAEEIAKEIGARGIVTGESLGQVSSQTPENILSINATIDFPVYRPLIGFDKDEITDLARNIGTYIEDSKGEFCALFNQKAVISSDPAQVNEDMMNFTLIPDLVRSRKTFSGRSIDSLIASFSASDLSVSEPPEGSILVDLRSRDQYRGWHYPGSYNVSLGEISKFVSEHGREKNYVFYCQKGLQSAFIASKLRNEGFSSYYIHINKLTNSTEK